MSNASAIFTAATDRLAAILGPTYKPMSDLFSSENQAAPRMAGGYRLVLLDAEEASPQNNGIFLTRKVEIEISHRTFAANATNKKVTVKLATVYDLEKAIIDSFRTWRDSSIGLFAVLPKTDTSIEQTNEEDDFLLNKITFTLQYYN